VKLVTPRKLVAASRALAALSECDDLAEVLHAEWERRHSDLGFMCSDDDLTWPHPGDVARIANILAAIATPNVDVTITER